MKDRAKFRDSLHDLGSSSSDGQNIVLRIIVSPTGMKRVLLLDSTVEVCPSIQSCARVAHDWSWTQRVSEKHKETQRDSEERFEEHWENMSDV
jgi:hypothetical protein